MWSVTYSVVTLLAVLSGFVVNGNVDSCTNAADAIVDYVIDKFLVNQSVQSLPDTEVAILSLHNLKLFGLNTIYRSCPITLGIKKSGEIGLKVCAAARGIRVSTNITASMVIWKAEFAAEISVENFNAVVKASALLEPGNRSKLDELSILSAEPKIKFTGSLEQISRFINSAVKKQLMKAIIDLISHETRKTLQQLLNENPL